MTREYWPLISITLKTETEIDSVLLYTNINSALDCIDVAVLLVVREASSGSD